MQTFNLEKGIVGTCCNPQSLCKVSLHTDLQEALFSRKAHRGSDLEGRRVFPQIHQWRKEITPDTLQDSRLKWAHMRRAFAHFKTCKGFSHSRGVRSNQGGCSSYSQFTDEITEAPPKKK